MSHSRLLLLACYCFLIGCAHTQPEDLKKADAPRPAPSTPAVQPSQPAPIVGVPPARAPRELRAEDFQGLSWRGIGPANMGGRVADIALAPGKAGTFFVATGTGGLWKTSNAGTTFTPVFDKEATASIGSVVVCDAPPDWPGWKDEPKEDVKPVDPNDPRAVEAAGKREREKGKAKIVWVGTGEGNGRNSSSWGRGVYRSTDGGSEFKPVGLPDSHDIPRLAVDPKNPDVCYAAALGHLWGPNKERGIYKTTDGGKTWTPSLQIDENTGACDVILDPSDPNTVYAAMYMRRRTAYSYTSGGSSGGIYKSTDAGATWAKLGQGNGVNEKAPGGLPAQTGRIGLDICREDPRIVYAVVESDLGGNGQDLTDDKQREGGVFRSEDHGQTWTRVSDRSPRAFYFSKVRVDPANDQRVYLLGFGLYVSDDGGRHWRAGGARKPHGDLHAMAIDPAEPEHLLLGTDGGAYVSHDGGGSWDFMAQMALGEFYNISFDSFGEPGDFYRIAGGLQDNGSWMGPSGTSRAAEGEKPDEPGLSITSADWDFVYDGDGYHFGFDPTNRDIVYAEFQGGGICRCNVATAVYHVIRPQPKEGQSRFRFNWNTPFFVSPHTKKGEPTTLYMGGSCVFKLTEGGDHWQKISEDLSTRDVSKVMTVGSEAETHGTVVSLAESPLAPGMLWAGTDDGLVHVTADDGQTWANVTPPEVSGRYISRVEASYHDPNTAYLAIDGHRMDDMAPHLMMTADAGKTWRSIAGDLPGDAPVLVVREDRVNPKVLYAGTETAAYISIDAGSRWVRLNGNTLGKDCSLPTVAVDDLQQHPREMDLVAATHGRSIFVMDDASPLSQLSPAVLEEDLHLFDIRPARPHLLRSIGGFWSERMFGAPNPSMGARITYWLRDWTREKVKIVIEDAAGKTVRELTGAGQPGLNRVVWDLQPDEHERLPNPDKSVGAKEFVPPGQYNATITMGKVKLSKAFTVLESPK